MTGLVEIVGRSTLISRISAVQPKIADCPFTFEPHLGVVSWTTSGVSSWPIFRV